MSSLRSRNPRRRKAYVNPGQSSERWGAGKTLGRPPRNIPSQSSQQNSRRPAAHSQGSPARLQGPHSHGHTSQLQNPRASDPHKAFKPHCRIVAFRPTLIGVSGRGLASPGPLRAPRPVPHSDPQVSGRRGGRWAAIPLSAQPGTHPCVFLTPAWARPRAWHVLVPFVIFWCCMYSACICTLHV